jgi:all-trans-retinol dehydrogenase (NAD+)
MSEKITFKGFDNDFKPLKTLKLYEHLEKIFDMNFFSIELQFQMVKMFLPDMIEQKDGKIVAIASMAARLTTPLASIYDATKCGIDGFMESLYDDLCLDDLDEFIKLSTVYPYFINTRKELCDVMDEINDFIPRMSPEFVAEKVVEGVLKKKRQIFVTPLLFHLVVK